MGTGWLAIKGVGVAGKMILLFAGHALCDFPLQGPFLSEAKNQRNPIPGVPWYQCLFAHAMIHTGMVYIITQSATLALLEFVIHFGTDYAKSEGKLTFNQDQAIHYACKIAWALLLPATPTRP